MKRALLAVLLVAGCASQQEKDAALDTWEGCIRENVRRLDDGRTDPVSLAVGVSPNCVGLWNSYYNMTMATKITKRAQDHAREELREDELRLITAAIVAHRASVQRR